MPLNQAKDIQMAVSSVRTASSLGYGSVSAGRGAASVRDAGAAAFHQIEALQGGLGAETFGLAQQSSRSGGLAGQARVPIFSSLGLVPMAFFLQEKATSAGSGQQDNSLGRGLGPNAAGRGAGVYDAARRTIEGGKEENWRYS